MEKESDFLVTVVIPVYNAAKYVTQAVESALAQPETGEILLVEDRSPDNALEICQQLVINYNKVKLLRHPNGENRGAGASRNLGIQNAKCKFIAFLDADDFYLSGRFSKAKIIFETNPDCEGVYEAVGHDVVNDAALDRWNKSNRKPVDQLITVTKIVAPEQLGELLISGIYGTIHLNGFVIAKDVINKSGFMAENLRLHQDTEFIIRCALSTKLFAGELESAVAIVRIHEQNRFSAPRSQSQDYKNKMNFWLSLYHWAKYNSSNEIQKKILSSIFHFTKGHKYFRLFPLNLFPTRLIWLSRLLRLIKYPEVVVSLLKPPKTYL